MDTFLTQDVDDTIAATMELGDLGKILNIHLIMVDRHVCILDAVGNRWTVYSYGL